MARYGSWEDRPRESRESGQGWERDRWRRESEELRGREDERWRAERDERDTERRPRYGAGEYGSAGQDRPYDEPRTYGGGTYGRYAGYGTYRGEGSQERWDRYGGEHREYRPEVDPPWVERGPYARGREDSRGMVEWEDRGPLKWLGDKFREATGRPARGPKGYKRSDERIHDDVCERIARSGVDADEVEVKVEKCEVTLSGTVHSRAEKWRLEEVADDTFGVEDVHNHLRVSRTSETSERERTDPGAIEGRGLRH
jgi:hypothetical protein